MLSTTRGAAGRRLAAGCSTVGTRRDTGVVQRRTKGHTWAPSMPMAARHPHLPRTCMACTCSAGTTRLVWLVGPGRERCSIEGREGCCRTTNAAAHHPVPCACMRAHAHTLARAHTRTHAHVVGVLHPRAVHTVHCVTPHHHHGIHITASAGGACCTCGARCSPSPAAATRPSSCHS